MPCCRDPDCELLGFELLGLPDDCPVERFCPAAGPSFTRDCALYEPPPEPELGRRFCFPLLLPVPALCADPVPALPDDEAPFPALREVDAAFLA